jgi:hypothetical protein
MGGYVVTAAYLKSDLNTHEINSMWLKHILSTSSSTQATIILLLYNNIMTIFGEEGEVYLFPALRL